MTRFPRFVGKCTKCKTAITVENDRVHIVATFRCRNCSNWVQCVQVEGRETEHKCGAKCRHATGPTCDCSCGGKFHGVGNMIETQVA